MYGFPPSSLRRSVPTSPNLSGPSMASPYRKYSPVNCTWSPGKRATAPSSTAASAPPNIVTLVSLNVLSASRAGPVKGTSIVTSSSPNLNAADRRAGSKTAITRLPCILRFCITPPCSPVESSPTFPENMRHRSVAASRSGMTPTLHKSLPPTRKVQQSGSGVSTGGDTRSTGPLGEVNSSESRPRGQTTNPRRVAASTSTSAEACKAGAGSSTSARTSASGW
mmetsp:Transcript_60480/g.161181  ORF Transcript_60480/g.161181 Transcript_60480/m.161181 type:complete len:223 (+) Transcript_60480:2802-3470(+)